MKHDVHRLQHLRQITKDRKAAYRAAADDRLDQREQVQHLERQRAVIVMNHGEGREAEALDALDRRIAAAREELAAMQAREDELATASSTAGRTFQTALDYAREVGLDLPEDLQPRTFGAPAPAVTEA